MSTSSLDSVLIQWGDRLFYPGNRMVRAQPLPRFTQGASRQRADAIRARIAAAVLRRAPQVMVKVTGGGRGMHAIAAHFRYISKNGRLDIEDDRGDVLQGKDMLGAIADDWRFGGSFIDNEGTRREALNIMLSMPQGTDPSIVQRAARQFAKAELAAHKYVMVLHDHQANPHVHISVRVEGNHGRRLRPRKVDLQRWRETFAEKLREYGVDAEATRQATRGRTQNYPSLWRVKAKGENRLRGTRPSHKSGKGAQMSRAQALEAWQRLSAALASSSTPADHRLAAGIEGHVQREFVEPIAVSRPKVAEQARVASVNIDRSR